MASFSALIVDDEPFVRADLKFLLMPHPQIVVAWETGILDEARAILEETPVDLVFLDICLRGGNGFDLLPWIDPQRTAVIIMTAHERFFGQAGSALALLVKPVKSGDLDRAVTRLEHWRTSV